ncbi:MAG TPA: hypothetical protein VEC93_21840, partial [Anaerolineae bacterium]|nr:hypothetical protein [Anaerolineae bacterium]
MLNYKINHKLTIALARVLIGATMIFITAIAPLWATSQGQTARAETSIELVQEHDVATVEATVEATTEPTVEPTEEPTDEPTEEPTPTDTPTPTETPTETATPTNT